MVLAIPKPSIFAAVLIKLSINMDKEYIELFTAVMGLAIVVIDLICKLKKKKEWFLSLLRRFKKTPRRLNQNVTAF